MKTNKIKIELDDNALNEAGWAVVFKYLDIVGEPMSGREFNNLKPLLKIAIEKYLELTNKELK